MNSPEEEKYIFQFLMYANLQCYSSACFPPKSACSHEAVARKTFANGLLFQMAKDT
jgi:hypothetical protein